MQAKLYVGNLSYQASEDDLKNVFGEHGTVMDVQIVRDRYSGQSKGFAFVQMGSAEDASKALALDGTDLLGRKLTVSEARPPRKDKGPSKFGSRDFNRGGRGGGGGGGGRGGESRGFGGRKRY